MLMCTKLQTVTLKTLKILADNKPLIDTRLMSDPISIIYKEFKEY